MSQPLLFFVRTSAFIVSEKESPRGILSTATTDSHWSLGDGTMKVEVVGE